MDDLTDELIRVAQGVAIALWLGTVLGAILAATGCMKWLATWMVQ